MKKIIKYGKYVVLLSLIILSIIVYKKESNNEELEYDLEIEENVINEIEPEKVESIEKTIRVDIKGEVATPGVYELKENDRVIEAINISGGLTENADTSLINLSKNLKDEMVIVIYNKNTIEKIKNNLSTTKTITEYIEKECICPDTINDACINNKTSNITGETEKININKDSIEKIMTIPGIGESKAKAIIKYREETGMFKEIEDITKVNGIGESTFENIKDYITI